MFWTKAAPTGQVFRSVGHIGREILHPADRHARRQGPEIGRDEPGLGLDASVSRSLKDSEMDEVSDACHGVRVPLGRGQLHRSGPLAGGLLKRQSRESSSSRRRRAPARSSRAIACAGQASPTT